jgi:hypothetical protein
MFSLLVVVLVALKVAVAVEVPVGIYTQPVFI